MIVDYVCAICANPVESSAYVCQECTHRAGQHLRGAELAGEVETTVALLARYAARGGSYGPQAPEVRYLGPCRTLKAAEGR